MDPKEKVYIEEGVEGRGILNAEKRKSGMEKGKG